jgi:hypothetical protein
MRALDAGDRSAAERELRELLRIATPTDAIYLRASFVVAEIELARGAVIEARPRLEGICTDPSLSSRRMPHPCSPDRTRALESAPSYGRSTWTRIRPHPIASGRWPSSPPPTGSRRLQSGSSRPRTARRLLSRDERSASPACTLKSSARVETRAEKTTPSKASTPTRACAS